MTSVQTLTNKTISGPILTGALFMSGSVRSSIVAVPALNVDCSQGNYFIKTITSNSTFTFSNAPSGVAFSFTLELMHSSGSVTWPTNLQWPGGTVPTLTAGKTHLFMFVTDDSGSRWRGVGLTNYTN